MNAQAPNPAPAPVTINQPAKPAPTLDEMTAAAKLLATQDVDLTKKIDELVAQRSHLRKERRALEGKITTARINAGM